MFDPPPLRTPVPAVVLTLAAAAKEGRLVICAGAGLSVAADASLPSGAALSEMLHERLRQRLAGYQAPENVRDLIAVADAAVLAAGGGLEALQYEVLELADFETATPNHGHQVLGLLLAEGAVTALSWNWDDCIERAAPPGEQLRVARTHLDMASLRSAQLAKVHGCATMPPTLLITSAQLAGPPPWADQAFADRLRDSMMVFVGIGDVADYARRRIAELIAQVRPPDVRVVSPSIREAWADSVWSTVLENLDEDRRVASTADEFLDQLARAWTGEVLQQLRVDACNARDDVQPGIERIAEALGDLSAVEVIRWCRRAVMRPRTGESAVLAQATGDALVAAGVLASRSEGRVRAGRPACCDIGDETVDVLVVRQRTPAADVQREAARRAEQMASNGQLVGDEVTFLVGGSVMGRLDESAEAAADVLSAGDDPQDVIDGPRALRPRYLRADILLQEAA